jgi:protein MpaA
LRPRGVTVREVACVGVARTLLIAEIVPPVGAGSVPVVAIAAGVHGDEPASVWALLALVRDGLLDSGFAYRIWPCTNPSGYELGTRANAEGSDINRSFGRGGQTPEAKAIITANRDRKFALTIDMHEDYEADGFYCYEPIVDDLSFGAAVVSAVHEASFPIQELDDVYDLGYPPESHHLRRLEHGLVRPNARAEIAYFKRTPYSMHLLRRAAKRSLTLESPRRLRWDERIAIHRVAVVTALERLHVSL